MLPRTWLLAGIAVLACVHLAWTIGSPVSSDIGEGGVHGALSIIHGRPLYGADRAQIARLGSDPHLDTYGPVNYEAYVPFAGLLDGREAARWAAAFFDLLTAGLLFLLGRRTRGPTAGVLLAYSWLAFPLTLYVDELGANDALVAATLVAALLATGSPRRRRRRCAGRLDEAHAARARSAAGGPRPSGTGAPPRGGGVRDGVRARHRGAVPTGAHGRGRHRVPGPDLRFPARPPGRVLGVGAAGGHLGCRAGGRRRFPRDPDRAARRVRRDAHARPAPRPRRPGRRLRGGADRAAAVRGLLLLHLRGLARAAGAHGAAARRRGAEWRPGAGRRSGRAEGDSRAAGPAAAGATPGGGPPPRPLRRGWRDRSGSPAGG